MQFVDAQVDKSLGNIRENIRKGAHQKHISTSIVDPLKEMKKSGKILHSLLRIFNQFFNPLIKIQTLMCRKELTSSNIWSNWQKPTKLASISSGQTRSSQVVLLLRNMVGSLRHSSLPRIFLATLSKLCTSTFKIYSIIYKG